MSLAANYIYVHTVHLARTTDLNLLPGAPVTANVPGTNGAPFQNWGAPQCQVLVNNPCFTNPLIFNNNMFVSTAGALYQGGTLELKKRFNHRSEEHTSELQSRLHLVCRLLLEKKKR